MKKLILLEIFNGLKTKPQLLKKLKVLAVIGALGVLLVGVLTVYLGVVGVRYVASVTKEANIVEQVEKLRTSAEKLPVLAKGTCITAAQGLLSLDTLLGTPVQENIQNLKSACFEKAKPEPIKNKESELM